MKVSVIGLGYVGSVAATGLASAGHDVLGIDVDRTKVESYRRGEVPFYEPRLAELLNNSLQKGNLHIMHAEDVVEPLGDAIVIATGTPATETGGVDLSYVKSAISWIKEQQWEGGVIVMKSTVPPGTGVRLQETILQETDYQYVSNPEFLREGQAIEDWFYPDRIVIGSDSEHAVDVVKALFTGIEAPLVECDITSAEMIKYAANAFLATKISFINEIAALCDKVGATIDDVTDGISLDPRIGPSFLKAGVGYGGSCFPKDTRALDDLALTNGHNFELLRSVITVNNRQRLLPLYALRERFGGLLGIKVGVLGLSFKPHTDDVRESPSLDLIRLLVEEGAIVKVFDPKVSSISSGLVPESVHFASGPLGCAEECQALVLMTEWPEIVEADWESIANVMRLPRFMFDGRNALDSNALEGFGFRYRAVGRGAANRTTVRGEMGN